MPKRILQPKNFTGGKNKLAPGIALRKKMLLGPSTYYKDKNGGIHFVKKSAGQKAVANLGWEEISWKEAYKENFLKSQREKTKKK